jgi:hypothetical protein
VKVKAAEGGRDLLEAGDDLVRIVTKLTSDLERFDALLILHRKMLEQRSAGQSGLGDTQLTRQSERLSQEAANMVVSIQQALEQLRELSQASKPGSRN